MRASFWVLALTASVLASAYAGADDKDEPVLLSPASGGRTVAYDALKPGDLVVLTTNSATSLGIRYLTKGPVSHVMLYLGAMGEDEPRRVVEALASGVRIVDIEQALEGAVLAAAFRHPDVHSNSVRIKRLREMAIAVSNAKYAKFGVVVDFVCRYARLPDRICSVAFPNRFQDSERNRSFYCSQLIDEMYQHAGVDLTPGTSTMPDDIRVLSFANVLDYVGHLRGGG